MARVIGFGVSALTGAAAALLAAAQATDGPAAPPFTSAEQPNDPRGVIPDTAL
ncbi:hypothetical protein [Xylella fastidiosa]|uniref:hypothetical protein n=1 Tax=Xylella fastidiosa TaxID=2371 RepID=UPI001EEADA57|nr:hypothetical protein [Xylella fastidiosa]